MISRDSFPLSTSMAFEFVKLACFNALARGFANTHCMLQVQLYEDFAKSQVKKGLEESVSHIDDDEKEEKRTKDTPHIFQVSFPIPFLSAIHYDQFVKAIIFFLIFLSLPISFPLSASLCFLFLLGLCSFKNIVNVNSYTSNFP